MATLVARFQSTDDRGRGWRFAAASLAVLTLIASLLSGANTAVAAVPVPAPGGNDAVITVKVGSDRSGTASVTPLAGVVLGLFANAGDTSPVSGFGTCTSDADGDCSFTVPETQRSGTNRDVQFSVKQISAPQGYYSNPTLAVGTSPTSQPYSFLTGTELRKGQTYSSLTDFMIDTGSSNNLASGGVWQVSRINPTALETCGLSVAIIADLSNSVTSTDLVQLKGAAKTLVSALTGSPSTVSLFTFATDAPAAGNANHPELIPVSTPSSAATATSIINAWAQPGGNDGGTNWDRAFAVVAKESQHYDLVVVITDGNPTFYSTNAVQGPGSRTRFREVENGIFSANAIKAEKTRMLAMGVGSGISGAPDNLRSISGTTSGSDYYQTADYAAAGAALRALALGPCKGSLTVVKQVLPPGTSANSIAGATPAGGWTFSASADSGVTVTPSSGSTADVTGALNLALAFPGGTTTATATAAETQQAGYSLHQVNGANATCIRSDTGASVTAVNSGALGFAVPVSSLYPVSCTVYNVAPAPPAQVVVTKVWNVDGTVYPQGTQPAELTASLKIDDVAREWGATVGGFDAGDTVSLSEESSVADGSLCTITGSRLTKSNGATVDLAVPHSAVLAAGANSYQITNTATCPAHLTLIKQVMNGPAQAADWTLTATAPGGALAGPTGTTGVNKDVTPGATYVLAESAGDPRYVQLASSEAVAIAGSTASWNCVQVNPTTGAVIPGFSDGLNGGVQVPRGFSVRCTAQNETAELTLVKHVVNTYGGTATAADWNLIATPIAPPAVPAGLTAQTVTGSEDGATIFVRPGQSYRLSESGPGGYSPGDWTCTDGTLTGTTLTVDPGGSATCSITNTEIQPTLTLKKRVTDLDGTDSFSADWTLTATNRANSSDTPIDGTPTTAAEGIGAAVTTGVTYNLSESGGAAGYTSGTVWTCTGGGKLIGDSQITLGSGENVTCTITNVKDFAPLTIAKSVTASYDIAYLWSIDKAVDKTEAVTAPGGSVDFHYTVTATPDGSEDSHWTMSGVITVTNPNDVEVPVTVADASTVGGGADCTVTGGATAIVPAEDSLDLDYSCTFTSAPTYTGGTNTATVTWTRNGGGTSTSPALPVIFQPGKEINKTIHVQDDKATGTMVDLGTASWNATGTPTEFEYDVTFVGGAFGECDSYTNTAQIEETSQQAQQAVRVCANDPAWTLTKASDPAAGSTVDTGSTVSYTLTARNVSDATVTGATATDTLPSGVTLVTPLPAGLVDNGDATLTWTIPEMAAGSAAVTVVYQVTVDDSAAGTALTNVVVPDSEDGTCIEAEDCTTTHPVTQLIAVVGDSCVQDASFLTFDLSTVNVPDASSLPVTVTWRTQDGTVVRVDTIPAGQLTGELLWPGTVLNADGVATQWPGWRPLQASDFPLAPGSEIYGTMILDPALASYAYREMTVTFEMNPKDVVQVTYPGVTPAGCAVSRAPNLSITKTASAATVTAGDTLSYDIVVRNNSTLGVAYPVTLSDPIPANLKVTGITTASVGFPHWQNCMVTGKDSQGYGGTLNCALSAALGVSQTAPTVTVNTIVRASEGLGVVVNTATTCWVNPSNGEQTKECTDASAPVIIGVQLAETGGNVGRLGWIAILLVIEGGLVMLTAALWRRRRTLS